jgi:aminotransferase
MEHLINPKVKDIQISGIRQFFNMVSSIDGMISLTIGQPDFYTPTHIKEAAKKAIDDNFTSYTHNAGFLALREAVSSFLYQNYHISYNPHTEIIVTNGASQAIDVALRTILQDGVEVILPGPVYPGYEPIIRMMNANPIYVDTRKNNFKLTASLIEQHLSAKTRCIILPYPSNPTGMTLTNEELAEIANLVRGKDIFIVADEIYSELVYDKPHVSIASMLKEQTIFINGLSKSHAMTGWRIGFLCAHEPIAKHMLKVHQYSVSCASSISQRAAYEALTNGWNDSKEMKQEYTKRRTYVYERLQSMGLPVLLPDGAFYFFVPIPKNIDKNSFEFAVDMAQQVKVAVVPGSAFSPMGEGYVRISYACSLNTLQKGLDRMEEYINTWNK